MKEVSVDIIAAVVDRSGSMYSIKGDAEGGLNAFLEEQKNQGNARLTLAEFDGEYDVVHNNMDISLFEGYTLNPRGGTALYDAIGKTAASVKTIQATGKKVFVIVTDGGENASKEWTSKKAIFEMIEEMKDDGWEIMFIGADEKAMDEARSLGVDANTTFMMNTNVKGAAQDMYGAVSAYTTSIRGGLSKSAAVADMDETIAKSGGALRKRGVNLEES